MGNKLYVGNLAFSVNADSLTHLFSEFGSVESAKVITDRDTGRSKGFGFVEMSSSEEALKCIESMNGYEYEGRVMNISEAKPQVPREDRGGGRGRY